MCIRNFQKLPQHSSVLDERMKGFVFFLSQTDERCLNRSSERATVKRVRHGRAPEGAWPVRCDFGHILDRPPPARRQESLR